MVKGLSIKFVSFEETLNKLFKVIKFDEVIKKHNSIVIKPFLDKDVNKSTNVKFIEEIVKFCITKKNPEASVFIADGLDGYDTIDVFAEQGYKKIAESFSIGLIDLNKAECHDIGKNEFVWFETIKYPSILTSSLIISAPTVRPDEKIGITGSLASMRSAFPSKYYKGIFSSRKNKLDNVPIKYQIHDILLCKIPDVALLDVSDKERLLAGTPIDMDKKAAEILSIDWKTIGYIRMIEETLAQIAHNQEKKKEKEQQ